MRALLLVLASCSFVTVRGPDPAPGPPGDCTTSAVAPGLDALGMIVGVLGTLAGGLFLYDANQCSATHPPGHDSETCGATAGFGIVIGVPSVIAAVAYGASAHYGNERIEACHRARRARAEP